MAQLGDGDHIGWRRILLCRTLTLLVKSELGPECGVGISSCLCVGWTWSAMVAFMGSACGQLISNSNQTLQVFISTVQWLVYLMWDGKGLSYVRW